ncbi:MAG: hypothetical protein ACK44W_10565, partial [Planctomycetota bacterium]
DFPLPAFTDDLTRLMVQRGVTSLAARPDLAAGQTALALLVFSFVVLAIVYSLRRDVWAVWPMKP